MQAIRKIFATLAVAFSAPIQQAFAAAEQNLGSIQQKVCLSSRLPRDCQWPIEFCQAVYTAPENSHSELSFTQHACADQYCVYTDTQFSEGRGISIITTADALHSSAAAQRSQTRGGNEAVVKIAVDAFETMEIAGKGIGLAARRPLKRGELIVSESPPLIVHLGTQEDMSEEMRLEMQRAAVAALPPATKAQVLELMANDEQDAIEARLQVNAFAIPLNRTVEHQAMFIQSSVRT